MYVKSPYPDVPPTPEVNIHHLLFHRPEQAQWNDYTLYIDADTDKRQTFRGFLEYIQLGMTALGTSVAEGGLGLGTWQTGEMIGIIAANSADYAALVHCLLGLTTPFVPISPYFTPFELNHALGLAKFANNLGVPSSEIYALGGRADDRKSFSELIDHTRTKKMHPISVRIPSKDALAYLMLSSGTTGLPKVLMVSHGNIVYCHVQNTIMLGEVAKVYTPAPLNTPDGLPVTFAFLPLTHGYGLYTYLFRSFIQRSTFVFSQWNIEISLKAISKYKVSVLTLVPSVLHQIVNYPGIRRVDFSSVQNIVSGGAYLSPDLVAKIRSMLPQGAKVLDVYGLSECTIGAVCQIFPGVLGRPHIAESTGILTPGMDGRILREDGTEADVEEVGELYLRGGNVVPGYWQNKKATKETFLPGGWLKTGDRFKVDKDGNFFYADRVKDTLKVSGTQVSPVEIEKVLLANPKKLIIDVTAAGVSGGRTSDENVPRAWIVLSDAGKKMGGDAVKQELEQWHRDNLSKYKWLRGGIEIVDEIPKSRTGKVLRRILQNRYEQQNARQVKL